MKQITSYCDKTIENTATKISDTESIVKEQLLKKE